MQKKFPNIVGHIQKRFIAGLFLCFPLLLTFFILKFLLNIIDQLFEPLMKFIPWVSDHTTGISAIITLAFIYFVGLISGHILGKRLVNFFLRTLPQRIPFVNKIYSLSKGFIDAISPASGDDQKLTGKVVLIKLSPFDPQLKMLGLLMSIVRIVELPEKTSRTGVAVSDKPHGVIFFSSSPFPQTGQLAYVPLHKIFEVKRPAGNCGENEDILMTKREFLRQEEYMGIIGSIATITPKTFIIQPIDAKQIPTP